MTPGECNRQRGFLLISLLLTTFLIIAIGLVASQMVVVNYRVASSQFMRTNAQFVADAGVDYAIDQINEDATWTSTNGEVEVMNENDTRTTFEAAISNGTDEFHKVLTVTGRTYKPAGSTTPHTVRSFEVILLGIGGVGFENASVVTGVGGLIMDGNAEIHGGQVYVNGRIIMNSNAKIGQSDEPGSIKVAHQSCPVPADASYPQVCNPSEHPSMPPPILVKSNAKIYGDVQTINPSAVEEDKEDSIVDDVLGDGDPAPVALPGYGRQAQQDAVAETITGSEASDCSGSGDITWPANLKIIGDVVLESKCNVTVEGNVWITGTLEVKSNSDMRVRDGLAEAPVIMVDGENGIVLDSNVDLTENNNDKGFQFITYWSDAICSPDCDDVTGSALYDSQGKTTILVKSNVEAKYAQFNARWSQAVIDSNGAIGAVAGQTVFLKSNATITFNVSVSESGGDPPISAWVVESYKRVYE